VLARLRYEFRGGMARPGETEAQFVERCAAWIARRLGDNGTWRCWVATGDDAILGTAWLQLVEKLPNPAGEPEWHGYVTSLYVRPEHRGGGLGSALLDACIRHAQARAVDALILWPTPASRRLYLRHGFAVREDLLERRLWKVPAQEGVP
jgi:GNAT superfamily N-acetyltransferase